MHKLIIQLHIKYLRIMDHREDFITLYSKHSARKQNRKRIYRLRNYSILYYISDEFCGLIMARKITPKTAIAFIKLTIALSFSWPLSKSANKFQVILFKVIRSLLCMHSVILAVPVSYTLYRNDYNLAKVMKLWVLLAAFIQVPLEITQCALQYDRLQVRDSYLQRYRIDFR